MARMLQIFLLLLELNELASREHKDKKISKHPFSGVFTNTPALNTLNKWAIEATHNGGSVTFSDAYERENMVVSMINQGSWPLHVYEEYQLFSAGLGNVDSARLLLQYGVEPTLTALLSDNADNSYSELVRLAAQCKVSNLRDALSEGSSDPDEGLPDGTTPLIAAAAVGCTTAIKLLLEEGADPERTALHGMNAVMIASSRGHVSALYALVRGGAQLSATHKFAGTSALHMAAELGQVATITALCTLGIDADIRTALGGNALHTAAQVGASVSVEKLVQKPCSLDVDALMNGDTTALYIASQHGHQDTVRALLAAGAVVDYAMPRSAYRGSRAVTEGGGRKNSVPFSTFVPNSEAGNGACALHAAAENGHAQVVSVLLEGGMVVDSMCSLGVTALHLAAQYDKINVARVLLTQGAEVDKQSKVDSSTALYYAAGYGYIEMVRLLLQAGADSLLLRRGRVGYPLQYAALGGKYEVVQTMLDYLQNDDHRARLREMPILHSVCAAMVSLQQQGKGKRGGEEGDMESHLLVLKALILAGARVDVWSSVSDGSQTALHAAARSGNHRVVRILLHGAQDQNISVSALVNQPDGQDGCTALHIACLSNLAGNREKGRLLVVELLLRAGADVNATIAPPSSPESTRSADSLRGATPLYLAAASHPSLSITPSLIHALLAAGADPNHSLHHTAGGHTPLLAAIDRRNPSAVEALLFPPSTATTQAADPNKGSTRQMSSSQSPLLLAVLRGEATIVDLLLRAGADCNLAVATSTTATPLSLIGFAKARRDYDVLQVLTAYRACVEADEQEVET